MTAITRYFHIRVGSKGGATVCVKGNTDNPAQVDVQYTLCSRKDTFEKKVGRSFAEKAPTKIVALRYLPQELGRIAAKAKARYEQDYTFAIKYFLPKE